MLAATARLASSAISATCSPGRTPRHVSTAFRAPGINSSGAFPKFMPFILPNSPYFAKWLTFVEFLKSKSGVFEDPQKHPLGQILASVHWNYHGFSLRMFQN